MKFYSRCGYAIRDDGEHYIALTAQDRNSTSVSLFNHSSVPFRLILSYIAFPFQSEYPDTT